MTKNFTKNILCVQCMTVYSKYCVKLKRYFMVKKLKSWRWSRITKSSPWLNCFVDPDFKASCIFMIIALVFAALIDLSLFEFLLLPLLFMLLIAVIYEVCTAKEFVVVGLNKAKAYIYRDEFLNAYVLEIPEIGISCCIKEFEIDRKKIKARCNVLLVKKQNKKLKDEWFYIGDKMLPLGQCLRHRIFISHETKEIKVVINSQIQNLPFDEVIDEVLMSGSVDKNLFAIQKDGVIRMYNIQIGDDNMPNLICNKFKDEVDLILKSSFATYIYDPIKDGYILKA